MVDIEFVACRGMVVTRQKSSSSGAVFALSYTASSQIEVHASFGAWAIFHPFHFTFRFGEGSVGIIY